MKLTELEQQLFAVLFASGEPIEHPRLCESLDITNNQLDSCAKALTHNLKEMGMSVELRKLGDSLQLCTRPTFKEIIARTLDLKRNAPLSNAAMEVLAIIAYNQPVARGFIEQIRGVDSSSIVVSLVDKGLLEEAGRLNLPGRPISYRTTPIFLRCFGLSSLADLPPVDSLDLETIKAEAEQPLQLSFDLDYSKT